MTAAPYESLDVPVRGGDLHVGKWGNHGPVVLAVHGITGSHGVFQRMASALGGEAVLVAPDLRGRGRSSGLPGPYGMRSHADDVIAVLDHLGVESAPVIGHSLGAFVATTAALRHPGRVACLVLVDGGIAPPLPEGVDPAAVLAGVLGPALSRLERTFESREQHLAFWRAHPAFSDPALWDRDLEALIDDDLVGDPPELRSRASLDAVRSDGIEVLVDPEVRDAWRSVRCRVALLRADHGLLDEVPPLLPDELIDPMRATWPVNLEMLVEGTNPYSILLAPRGAGAVARHALAAAASASAPRV